MFSFKNGKIKITTKILSYNDDKSLNSIGL